MAKKSNKTEQVLKLITKDGEAQSGECQQDDLEICTKPQQDKQHKIETKLKIEIEPEIEIKTQLNPNEEYSIEVPIHIQGIEKDDNNERLVNLTECLVKKKAKEIMTKLNVCCCHTCTQDVLALSLNTLNNKFITTNTGKLHVQLEFYKKQYETDIVAALTKACVRVKVSPRHEK